MPSPKKYFFSTIVFHSLRMEWLCVNRLQDLILPCPHGGDMRGACYWDTLATGLVITGTLMMGIGIALIDTHLLYTK